MARNRMIKKEVLEDSKIGKLSDTAKWLFIGLWIIADDEGFLQSDTDWIKIKCFPYNPQIDIKKVLKELFDLHLINENNGIIKILNFLKHQTINRPAESDLCTIYRQNSVNNHGIINEDSHLNIKEVKEKEKLKEVNIKEKNSKELAVKTTTALLPQQEVYNYFSEKYEKLTNEKYLSKTKDFMILSKLAKNFGVEKVKQKIDWLEIACINSVFWFTNDKNDFTIGKLYQFWNEILPKLTEQQKADVERENLKAKVFSDLEERHKSETKRGQICTN